MTHETCKSGPFRVRLSAEKKLPTVTVGLFSLREMAPTKNTRQQRYHAQSRENDIQESINSKT